MRKENYKKGFTLIELLVVISVIAVLATVVMGALTSAKKKAYYARTLQEMKAFEHAMALYLADNGAYPPDASRNIPPGLEEYLGGGQWPVAPYPDAVYDWDNITGGDPYIQLSVRFCSIGGGDCNYPDEEWAEDFDSNSSAYWCFEGNCRAHPSQSIDHPGYCFNCN